jgi:hypothetical protein
MKKMFIVSLVIFLFVSALLAGAEAIARTYSTNFPLTENPISEGGIWHHLDPTLTVVQTEVINGVHVAHGTQTGSGGYDDSNAYLSGFSQDHSIEGTVWISPSIPTGVSPYIEIELLLRWKDDNPPHSTPYGPTSVTGYEININNTGAYLNLGTFKGPALVTLNNPPTPKTGDIFKAKIVSNSNGTATITAYWNGAVLFNFTDSSPVSGGNPGIGFYIEGATSNAYYGFSKIVASDLSESTTSPSPPLNLQIDH